MAKNLKNPISSKNKETFEVGSKETNRTSWTVGLKHKKTKYYRLEHLCLIKTTTMRLNSKKQHFTIKIISNLEHLWPQNA